jgi:hypothetical protein
MMMTSFGYGGPEPFGMFFTALIAIILIAAWVILAGSRFVQGGVVERSDRVPQLYGYTLCLIGLLWALTSAVSIVENIMTVTAPELRGANEYEYTEASVSSFEAFRITYDRARRFAAGGDPSQVQLDSIPDAELRRRYDAMRADRVRQVGFRARTGIITNSITLLIGVALFAFHWRWLRRRSAIDAV